MLQGKLQDVLDLLRTGTPPDAFGMTEQQWIQHKVNKACRELQSILDEMYNQADPEMNTYEEWAQQFPDVEESE